MIWYVLNDPKKRQSVTFFREGLFGCACFRARGEHCAVGDGSGCSVLTKVPTTQFSKISPLECFPDFCYNECFPLGKWNTPRKSPVLK